MNVEPEVEEDTKEYLCPANNSHKLYGEDNFLKHIMRCKDFEGRKFWCCKFQWTHMFHFREERDHHEQFNCDFKRPNVERFKDYFFLSKKQDSPDKAFEKRQNMTNSIYYYEKNKATLEYEKNLRRKLRQKREEEEAARMDQARKLQLQLQENNKYYTKEYVLENAIFINTDWGRFFLVLVAHGDRKIEKRNFEMKTTIDVGEKLQKIGHMEYKKILGGEFIAHPDYVNFFNRLKTTVDTESSLACEDFCESNDELIILTSSKYVPFLPENRLALLVVRKSKFSEPEGRPYHILDNNVSNVFVNEYEMFLDNDVRESEIRGFEGGNAENNTTIVTYEYKLQIEKKLRNIMELIQESISNQNTADQFKRENDQLEALLVDKDSLKAQEKKLAEKEGKIKNELDDYKRKLTHEFLNNVHSRQEELNTKINRYYASKLKELEATDQVSLMLEEEEAELTRKIQDARAEIEGLHKNKKLKENNIAKLEHLVAEKRKNIQISKSLALTNVLDSLCHVCQQNRINILYISCYHFYVCEECQKRASEVGRHECLYCLKPVDKVVRVIV